MRLSEFLPEYFLTSHMLCIASVIDVINLDVIKIFKKNK